MGPPTGGPGEHLMPTNTKRDRVWSVALGLAARTERFGVADVIAEEGLEASSKRTARDVLTTMVDQGWLRKRTCPDTGSRLYGPGDRLSDLVTPETPK